MEFKSEIVQVFRSDSGNGGFDICVLQYDGEIAIIHKTDLMYPDGTPGKYEIDEDLKFQVEGEFLQHDQDRDDNRFTFIMSKKDTGEILLNCFYQRKFFDLSKKINGVLLDEDTNFVFLFAEGDETRFII